MGIGRILIYAGLLIVAIGILFSVGERLPVKFGRLPGDIVWRGKNMTFYFPLTTLILLNVAIAFLMWLFNRR